MNRSIWFALSILALLAIGSLTVLVMDRDETENAETPRHETRSRRGSERSSRGPETQASSPSDPEASLRQLEELATVAGLVVTDRDQPLDRVSVIVKPNRRQALTAWTNASGEFEVVDVPAGRIWITVEEPGFLRYFEVVELQADERYECRIELQENCFIRGKVVDTQDRTVARARVEVLNLTPSDGSREPPPGSQGTDPDGAFEFVVPAGEYRITAAHRTSEVASPPVVRLDPGESHDLILVLPSGITVFGTVFGPDQAPLQGAQVRAVDPTGHGDFETTTDDAGNYELWGFAPETPYLLVAGRSDLFVAGVLPVEAKITIPRGVDRLRVDLGAGTTGILLSGRVTKHGAPVPDLLLQLLTNRRGPFGNFAGGMRRTDKDGEFRFRGVPAGPAMIAALDSAESRGLPVLFDLNLPDESEARVELAWPAGTITGRVTGIDQAPGQETKAVLTRVPTGFNTTFDHLFAVEGIDAVVDAEGNFLFESLRAGRYVLKLEARSYTASRSRTLPLLEIHDGERLDLGTLSLSGDPDGWALDLELLDDNGKDVPRAQIWVHDSSGQPLYLAARGLNGAAHVQGFGAIEEVTLRIYADHHAPRVLAGKSLDLTPGKPTVVRLNRGGSVRIVANGPGGSPAPEIAVSLLDARGVPFTNLSEEALGRLFARGQVTGQDGAYTFENVAAGTYRATAETGAKLKVDPAEFEVVPGETTTVRLTLSP